MCMVVFPDACNSIAPGTPGRVFFLVVFLAAAAQLGPRLEWLAAMPCKVVK